MTKSEQQDAPAISAEASSSLPDRPIADGGAVIFDAPPANVKRLLPPGAFRTDDHRYYFNGMGPVPGVTSVLDVLMKWDLVNWKTRTAAAAAYQLANERWSPAGIDLSEGDAVAAALLKVDEARDKQAKIGSGVHLLADLEARDGPEASESQRKAGLVPDEWIPYLDAYRGFLGRYGVSSIVSSEKMVWSVEGYGGTYDFLARWPCEYHGMCLWLVDVKTGKRAYPEHGLQLAAYRWADYIILPGDPKPYPMPQIQHTAVLHLRPDLYTDIGWRLIEYPVTVEDDFHGFLGALEAYKWTEKKRFQKSMLVTVT